MRDPPANRSNPSITHSWALKMMVIPFVSRNCFTRSGPNFTIFPVPFGSLMKFGWMPSSVSFSVGSDQRISTTNCYSGVETSWMTSRGHWIASIYSSEARVEPIPPWRHTILSSITQARGSQSNSSLILLKTDSGSPGSSLSLALHSSANPKALLIHLSSWFPQSRWILVGYLTFKASKRQTVSREWDPLST